MCRAILRGIPERAPLKQDVLSKPGRAKSIPGASAPCSSAQSQSLPYAKPAKRDRKIDAVEQAKIADATREADEVTSGLTNVQP
jgi:hypothetical protein